VELAFEIGRTPSLSIPKVGAALLIAFGLVLLIYFGHEAIQAVCSSSWPAVEGVVTESKVVQRTGRRNRKTNIPRITYRYAVDGVEHVGTTLFFGSQYSESWTAGAKWTSDTAEYMARYRPGTLLRVHYDPNDAATSVVETGLRASNVLPVIVSIVSIGGGIFVGAVERRRMAKLAPRESASMKAT
jgi:hypothetical protein